jgi:hypothetical protein
MCAKSSGRIHRRGFGRCLKGPSTKTRGRRGIPLPPRPSHCHNKVQKVATGTTIASGYLWEENRKQLAYKPLVIVQEHGRGLVVGFTADPNFRAFTDGMNVLFLNAVFRGPARARPAVSR